MTVINALLLWTAVSAAVAPLVGSQIGRHRVALTAADMGTTVPRERVSAAPPDH